MSETTMYVVEQDGTLSEFAVYRNSHGTGPQVWSCLSEKYVHGELYDLATRGGMEDWERRTAWACADYVICRPEDFACYADALEKFAEVYGPQCDGQAFHIGSMAIDLRRVAVERPDARGVCWQLTSSGATEI